MHDDLPKGLEARDAERLYHAWVPAAQAVGEPEVCRADPTLAVHNVGIGVPAVLALQDELKAALPQVDWVRIGQLPDLAVALWYAAGLVDKGASGAKGVREQLQKGAEFRKQLLAVAQAGVALGKLPADQVEAIRAGRGGYDTAQDLVALVALFRGEGAALAGALQVPAQVLDEAAAVGLFLVEALQPEQALHTTASPAEVQARQAARVRDQLWTLLSHGYADVRRVAFWKWLDDAGEHVPALRSARQVAKAQGAAAG